MSKKSIVISAMKEKLGPYGFMYKGYNCNCKCWTFAKEEGGISREVVIDQSAWGKGYRMECTLRRGKMYTWNTNQLLGKKDYGHLFTPYETRKEQEQVLEKLLDVAVRYGLPLMEEESKKGIERVYDVTPAMKETLMESKEAIVQEFLKKNQLDKLDADRVFPIVREEIGKTFDREFDEVQDIFIEAAAIVGTLWFEVFGGQWQEDGTIDHIPGIYSSYLPLVYAMYCWMHKNALLFEWDYEREMDWCKRFVSSMKEKYNTEWKAKVKEMKLRIPKWALEEDGGNTNRK